MKNIIILLIIGSFSSSFGQISHDLDNDMREADKKYKSADYKGAIEIYNYWAFMDYRGLVNYNIHLKSGNAKTKLKDFAGAIRDYNFVIEHDERSHESYYNRGIAKDKLGDYKGAAADYEESIRHFPFVESEGFTKGTGKFSPNVYLNAIKSLTGKISQNPLNGKLYHYRGIVNLESGNVNNACIDFYKAIELGFEGAGSFTRIYCK